MFVSFPVEILSDEHGEAIPPFCVDPTYICEDDQVYDADEPYFCRDKEEGDCLATEVWFVPEFDSERPHCADPYDICPEPGTVYDANLAPGEGFCRTQSSDDCAGDLVWFVPPAEDDLVFEGFCIDKAWICDFGKIYDENEETLCRDIAAADCVAPEKYFAFDASMGVEGGYCANPEDICGWDMIYDPEEATGCRMLNKSDCGPNEEWLQPDVTFPGVCVD